MKEESIQTLRGRASFVMEDGLDVEIIKWLAGEDKIFAKEKMEHNYPHCWRCGTPLVYYAKPSWYIEMTKLKRSAGSQQQHSKLVPCFRRRKDDSATGSQNVKDWAISQKQILGNSDTYLEMRMRSHLECIRLAEGTR